MATLKKTGRKPESAGSWRPPLSTKAGKLTPGQAASIRARAAKIIGA